MKTCTHCNTKVQEDDGRVNDEGDFICLECAAAEGESAGGKPTPLCPECEAESDEYEEEGVCPECGHVKESDEKSDAASDDAEAS